MSKPVLPCVYLIAEPNINPLGMQSFLDSIGVSDWTTDSTHAAEMLAEFMGRLCYRSFAPGLNPNVTKVREGNEKYLRNIIKSKHGSVLEHASFSFVFQNVSRVFTHELVRHRVGVAISQESLRYVRLSDGLDYPEAEALKSSPKGMALIQETMDRLEVVQGELAAIYDIDNCPDFATKKMLTSAFRRVAPIGLATTIGWSANVRTLRHVLEMRTSRHAEAEIRQVFEQVGMILQRRCPAMFGDYKTEVVDGYHEFTTEFGKI